MTSIRETVMQGLTDGAVTVGKDLTVFAIKQAAEPPLRRFLARLTGKAILKAEENAEDFVQLLAERVERLESLPTSPAQLVAAASEDPDFAAVIHSAVLGAARTNSRERHALLAQAVAQRLVATPGSVRAVASNLAVETIPRLANVHLEILGLLAVIWGIRPRDLIPAEPAENDEGEQSVAEVSAMRAAVTPYRDWLMAQLEVYRQTESVTDDSFAHLVSAACITFERKVRRDLKDVLLPGRSGGAWHRRTMFDTVMRSEGLILYKDAWDRWIDDLWTAGLQHARPTPTGLLIGCTVHDAKAGNATALEWEWADVGAAADVPINDTVWDGRGINHNFMDKLERELRDRGIRRMP
jgi:hypothetical protein